MSQIETTSLDDRHNQVTWASDTTKWNFNVWDGIYDKRFEECIVVLYENEYDLLKRLPYSLLGSNRLMSRHGVAYQTTGSESLEIFLNFLGGLDEVWICVWSLLLIFRNNFGE